MHLRPVAASLLFLGVSGAGCQCVPPGGDDGGADCGTTLAWGHLRDGGFTAFQSGDLAPVTEGFQGFRFIVSSAKVTGASPGTARFDFDISLEGQPPFSQPIAGELRQRGDALYADEVLVFFNDVPMPQLVGKQAEIGVHTSAGCGANQRVTVRLTRDTCRQVEDGGYQCDGG